ncbi:MAG: DUF126 domain-containing protein [Bacillota bacterium]|nr:DUF126 domain-containing protein [Bacillota bacterium]
MKRLFKARPVVPGEAAGEAIVSKLPLSFKNNINTGTGEITDKNHDLYGQCITGRALVIPRGTGSCTGTGTILEMVRQNTAPAAIICTQAEPVTAIGSVIAKALYGRGIPLYTLCTEDFESIMPGEMISVKEDGTVAVGQD